ncbi:MAG: energy-coupling factor ABC transporter permease [Candidatus Methylarchaceae archaeon HK01B]|nr:energy-coupling factor ABC transporter permease [Candidatus Methylarchaceae archaeon HK01M]MCP8312138.1 energy-coupling factor ABC transporter permease [Candidatus Methylarchaceae archaeon HK02M1]MCP8319231.1 energy-coupling factor ABC transporter permease [Candidatus Methylarchaceae archaeon HK01B]
MHIPDGFLDISICVITYLAAILFWAFALRKMKKVLSERHIPFMATLTAMFFAAQMMNYPIIGGTTAHLLGGPLLAIALGPYAGLISVTLIVFIQALLFGDGGLTTLGANVFNMGVVGVFIPYLLFLTSLRIMKGRKMIVVGAFLSSLIGDLLAAVFAGLELGLSALSFPYSLQVAVTAMGIHHFFIGIGEGIVTAMIVSILLKQRPDLLELPKVAPIRLDLPYISKDPKGC